MKRHRGPLKGGGTVTLHAVACFLCGVHTDPANKFTLSDGHVVHACKSHPVKETLEDTLLWSDEITDPDVVCSVNIPEWEEPSLPPHLTQKPKLAMLRAIRAGGFYH